MILLLLSLMADSWFIHYTKDDGGFQTDLMILNESEQDQSLKLLPYAEDGTLLTHIQYSITLKPGEQKGLSRFELGWGTQGVSHGKMEADESVRLMTRIKHHSNGAMPSLFASQTQGVQTGQFIPVLEEEWFDGLVFVNPNPTSQQITLRLLDEKGNTLRTTQLTCLPNAKEVVFVPDLFPSESGSLMQWQADSAMLNLGLRGSLGLTPSVLTELKLDPAPIVPAPLTYANQISRIMRRQCEPCHVSGGIAPFTLNTFQEVSPNAHWLGETVEADIMPPWRASQACQPLEEVQALDPAEKQMFLDWVAQGAPEGKSERTPAPAPLVESAWTGGQPDLVFKYQEAFEFPQGPDVYRCFPLDLGNEQELYLKGYEIKPGNPAIVHHVLLYAETQYEGEFLDSQESGPGYTCFGGPGTVELRLIGGWAPGMTPQIFPENVGMTLPKNSQIIMQIHYNYGSEAGSDHTEFGLFVDSTPPEKELLLLPLVDSDFIIPAGAKDYSVTASVTLPLFIPLDLYIVAPHMHLLGQSIWVEASMDDEDMCLVEIPKWDFNWQRFYTYKEPVKLPGGTKLTLNCTFDNSSENPFNPSNPPIPVGWGEATTDEMALCFLGVTAPFDLFKSGWEWPMKASGDFKRRQTEPSRYKASEVSYCCRPGSKLEKPTCVTNSKE